MKKPSPAFHNIIFVLLVIWFLLLAAAFFVSRPVALIALFPDLLLLALIIAAAYSIGSFATQQLQLDDVLLPAEDFVLATALGLAGLAFLTTVVGLLGLLTWWTIGVGLIIAIAAGFYRIIGLVTPPAYLFGPEDLGDEAPDPISWMQYIVIAIWMIALANFCFLPPVFEGSLAGTVGTASQWVLKSGIGFGPETTPESISIPGGLWAMALALRSPHLVTLISGLLGGLAVGAIYAFAKRYCGPLTARSALLTATSLPLFAFSILAPHSGLALALFQFCAFFCTLRWYDEKRKRWSVLGGIFIGLSLGVSATGLLFLPPLIAAAFIWAVIRKRAIEYIFNLLLAAVAAIVALFPWPAICSYLFGSAMTWAEPLMAMDRPPIVAGHLQMLLLPIKISFPTPALPPWEVIGPIFLVFVPFFFITYRKNPASGLAVATGLAFLGFGEIFGLDLAFRLAGLMLLAVPAALSAHRFLETGWRKPFAIGMLYFLIGWQIFHATAMVETVYSSPHRMLLGLESSEEFLHRGVDYYPTAGYINATLPGDARILGLGKLGLLYIEREMTLAGQSELGSIAPLLSEDGDTENALKWLRRRDYSHLLVNSTAGGATQLNSEQIETLNLRLERKFQDNGIILYALPDENRDLRPETEAEQ
ncbi:MAG TPA: glycosyltransferase family 39 protein [Acidobacteriota bacterium]|nr:glycosyltransferase family 39 protein [Acidobacteriota bacterium]